MNSARLVYLSVMIVILNISAVAQGAKGTAVITGRITIADQPVPGVEVLLKNNVDIGPSQYNTPPPIAAVSDADGRYRLTNIPAGSYRVAAFAPAYVIDGRPFDSYRGGKAINIAEGESLEGLDFKLVRGGVITGRVTDEEGKPVIAEMVALMRVDKSGKPVNQGPSASNFAAFETDDRGHYRIYGIDEGYYLVYAGRSEYNRLGYSQSGKVYNQTYHPDAADQKVAKIVEVKTGEVVEDIDIKLASAVKGYSVIGRVVDAETASPLVGIRIFYNLVKDGRFMSMGYGNAATNARGEFRLDQIPPGTYAAYGNSEQPSEFYSDSTPFQVTDGDITGIEIRMHRGATISGMLVLEGTRDPEMLAQLNKIQVFAHTRQTGADAYINRPSSAGTVSPNGTFKISGVRPGEVSLNFGNYSAPKGLALRRVEHNGAVVRNLTVNAGDQIAGVRMVFVYGTGSIAGRVEYKNGELAPGVQLMVMLELIEGDQGAIGRAMARPAEVDNRGQFLIEGIAAGNYKLRLMPIMAGSQGAQRIPRVEQTITIAGNIRQEAIIVVDFAEPERRPIR